MIESFLQGLGTGAGLIIAIGAQNAFVLTQGIRRNHALAVSGLCALLDALLIAAGVCGLGALVSENALLKHTAALGGAAFLLWFGARSLASAFKQNALSANAEPVRGLGATLAATVSLLRPAHFRTDRPDASDISQAVAVTVAQDVADANLVRMGDKHVLFSPSRKAYIMYGIHGRSWIALGDPIGAEDDFAELVWQFVGAARAGGGRAAFYQLSPALLSSCADVGLRAFKLGELAIVDLPGFELKGSRLANLRQSFNRGQRDGLTFSVAQPQEVPAILAELRAVSDSWLAHHDTREKTFSLGAFEDGYVAAQPVAVVRLEERIVAFATVMVTDTKAEATVDLMRFAPDAPKGTMDYLFVSILEYLRDAGYRQFNLGMAPLSGMARREAAPVWDRIGGTLFEHGERFYNFKGLRAFKAKFHPRWEPRYLAVSGNAGAALALMDVTFLIGGGVKGVISK